MRRNCQCLILCNAMDYMNGKPVMARSDSGAGKHNPCQTGRINLFMDFDSLKSMWDRIGRRRDKEDVE